MHDEVGIPGIAEQLIPPLTGPAAEIGGPIEYGLPGGLVVNAVEDQNVGH